MMADIFDRIHKEKTAAVLATATSNDIALAHPDLRQRIMRLTAEFEKATGYKVKYNDVTRSASDQARAFRAGYSTVDGKTSIGKHNYQPSMAVDLNVTDTAGNKPSKENLHRLYQKLGEMGEEYGLRWGGRWSVPYDPYHFELPQRGALSPPQVKVKHMAEEKEPVRFRRLDGSFVEGTVEQVIDPSALPNGQPNGKATYLVRRKIPRSGGGEPVIVVPEAQLTSIKQAASAKNVVLPPPPLSAVPPPPHDFSGNTIGPAPKELQGYRAGWGPIGSH